MDIKFTKMHGLGNDFMVFDLVTQHFEFAASDVKRWADRRTGIGFDQLLTIEPPLAPDADFRYRIFNADGSEAEQCGNGARCVAKLISELQLSPKSELQFETNNGRIETRLLDAQTVEVDMGLPRLDADQVPFDSQHACHHGEDGYLLRSTTSDASYPVVPVSMGNPHGVIFVDEITTLAVPELGSGLTIHPFFPEQANIGFCQIIDGGFVRLRVFERGVGETRACGTGACAAVVAGRLAGKLNERVKVSLPGGKVRIRWPGEGCTVKMTGSATLVFHGKLSLPA